MRFRAFPWALVLGLCWVAAPGPASAGGDGCGASSCPPAGVLAPPAGYTTGELVFDDSFQDLGNWNYGMTDLLTDGPAGPYVPWNATGAAPDWGSGEGDSRELEYWFPSQVVQTSAGGATAKPGSYDTNPFSWTGAGLTLIAQKAPASFTKLGKNYTWYSGAVNTWGKAEFGGDGHRVYFQVAMTLPSSAVNGKQICNGGWGGFGLLPGPAGQTTKPGYFQIESGWPPVKGAEAGWGVAGQPETKPRNAIPYRPYVATSNPFDGYHIFGIDYISGVSLTFYIDGQVMGYVDRSTTPNAWTQAIMQTIGNDIPSGPEIMGLQVNVYNGKGDWHCKVTHPDAPIIENVSEVQVYQMY